jgi:hypothetical protein
MKLYVKMAKTYGYAVEFRFPSPPEPFYWRYDISTLVEKNQHGVPKHALEHHVEEVAGQHGSYSR